MSQSGLHEPAERPVGASQTFGNQGTRRPEQASLRRSVSAAYYVIFHLLIDSAARRIFAGSDRDALRDCLRRAFKHRSEAGLACIRVNYVATRRPGRDKPVPYTKPDVTLYIDPDRAADVLSDCLPFTVAKILPIPRATATVQVLVPKAGWIPAVSGAAACRMYETSYTV